MKHTCFAYKEGECRALTKCICENGKCRFYKTNAERAAGLRKAEERIRSLDPDIVRHINAMYNSKL